MSLGVQQYPDGTDCAPEGDFRIDFILFVFLIVAYLLSSSILICLSKVLGSGSLASAHP